MDSTLREKTPLFGPPSFYRRALAIALPVMLQQLVQSLVSLVDQFMVAGLGDVMMSGVNISGQFIFVFQVLLNTMCMACGIFMTQYYGAGDRAGMGHALRLKLIAAGTVSLIFIALGLAVPRGMLGLMVIGNSDAGAILDYGVQYIRIMTLSAIPFCVSVVIASSMREIGSVRTPLVISVLSTLINTFFNYTLIYGHFGAPRLEVRGAAWATVIALCSQAVMFLFVYFVKKPPFAVPMRGLLRVDRRLAGRVARKGSLVLFSEMAWVLAETAQTAIYNGRGGADVVSGMASSFAIANLFFVAFGGVMTAVGVILGKSLGAGDLDNARRDKRWLMSASVVFGFMMTLVGLLTTLLVPVVFGRLSPGAVSICRRMVLLLAAIMPVWLWQNAMLAVSRAGGDTAMGVWTDAVITLAVIVPGMFALARFTSVGPVEMYAVTKLADLLKLVLMLLWIRRGRWLVNLADEGGEQGAPGAEGTA